MSDATPNLSWTAILMYHRVVPAAPSHDPAGNCVTVATFESHLRWLERRGYVGVSLQAVVESRAHGGRGTRARPRRAVVVTFDDGYGDNYDHAWPLLRRYGFGATIFMVSDAIDGDNEFDGAYTAARVPMLSTDQIRRLHAGGIAFGSHTCSHPVDLTALPDRRISDELIRSRQAIEAIIQSQVSDFSYPHSRLDPRTEGLVRSAGYRSACAGVGTRFAPHCLHRVAPPSRRGLCLELEIQRRRATYGVRRWQGRTGSALTT